MNRASWPVGRKIGTARSCNFPTDTAKFWQNSDRRLQIFNRKAYGCSTFNFYSKISPKWRFSAANLAFFTNIFWRENLWQFFDSQKFRVCNCLLPPPPPSNTITICPLATTPQPVNRIESNQNSFESNLLSTESPTSSVNWVLRFVLV